VKILVTGGAGYIGSHACKMLAENGHEPIVYDNLSRSHRSAVKWGVLEVGDIADIGRVQQVLKRYRPAALMHFAAYTNVPESVQNPLLYYRNNIGGTTTLLAALVANEAIPVVFSSTCATYGIPDSTPISEDHPLKPVNPYGFTKVVVERMLRDLDASHSLPSVCLRYFNVAGADGEVGDQYFPQWHLIPSVLRAARDNTPLSIFGDDYDTSDGTCIRDYIHVTDVANAHIRALDYLVSKGKTCTLNLASARGYSVKEIIAAAEKVCGIQIDAKVVARRPGDVPVLVGRADRARTILGWEPERDIFAQIDDAWKRMQK